mgnify:FL=1
MKILLHLCCGPCATFPVEFLRENNHKVEGYFYNQNIHPYKEFKKRLNTAREYAEKVNLKLIVDNSYRLEEFLSKVLTEPNGRCYYCYESRLMLAAKVAKEYNFEAFSTSLLVSPYQKHEMIKTICEKVAEIEQIPFFYYDYREGWAEGVEISKELELYRQPYCGCIFSERDRYQKIKKKTD